MRRDISSSHPRRRRAGQRALALLVALAVALCAVSSATAKKKKKKDEDEEEDQPKYTLSQAMADQLTAALEFLQNDQNAEAREILGEMEKRKRLNPYERALIFQLRGHVEAAEDNYPLALEYLEKCLIEDSLPRSQQLQTRFNAAQLYLATDKFEDTVRTLMMWFKEADKPTSTAYYLLAVAYYQLDDIRRARLAAQRAVAISPRPQEAWLQLLVGLLFTEELYDKAVDPLQKLVTMYPRKSYWKQLSALYAALGDEEKSFAVYQLLYEQDLLDQDNELRRLGAFYLYHGIPARCADVLETGLESEKIKSDSDAWELLANCWIIAREYEKAVGPLGKAAALSKGGKLYFRLGQLQLERRDYEASAEAFRKALSRGELDDRGNANYLLAIALYNLKQRNQAIRYFAAAQASEHVGASAGKWIELIEREAERERQIEEETRMRRERLKQLGREVQTGG